MPDNYDDWSDPWPRILPEDSPGVWVREASDPEALKSLLGFCVNNRDLDRLEAIISAFNPLKILGVTDFEIRHSNVLAWLLDPNGHHGLGDTLFKSMLLEIIRDYGGVGLPHIEDIIGAGFTDLKVLREWRNIDLFAVSPSNKLLVVIENKVNADESEHQLSKYVEIVERKYPAHKKVFVYLTLDGAPPKGSNRYIPFTHEQIYNIVQSVVELRRDYMHDKVYDFIQQYLQILEEKTMKNDEFIDICSKLYREHGDAIKMILTYGKPKLPPASIQDFHSRTETESVHAGKDSVNVYYTFIPQAWGGKVPITNRYTQDKYLVFFTWNFSEYETHKITLSLNIGHFPDPEERTRFVERVSKAVMDDRDCTLTIRKSSKTSTTVYSKSISLKYGSGEDCDLDDYEAVTAKMVEVYASDEAQQALRIVDGVVQRFEFQKGAK